jgi:putative ABC transport system substrate-binding protein
VGDPLTLSRARQILDFAEWGGVPTLFDPREFADEGGVLAYGPSFHGLYRRAAAQVDAILRGARPIDLPLESPASSDFVINLQAAQALGLTIPPSVLAQATELIQ